MGIDNIHILMHPDVERQYTIDTQRQYQVAYQQALIEAHRRGEHPYGNMRRDCPLCQRN